MLIHNFFRQDHLNIMILEEYMKKKRVEKKSQALKKIIIFLIVFMMLYVVSNLYFTSYNNLKADEADKLPVEIGRASCRERV